MGHGPIVVGNESQDLLLEILQRAEISSLEQFAHQDTEPDFHLIHPGSMLRSVREDDGCRVGSCRKAARVAMDWRMPLFPLMPKVSCLMPSRSAIQRTNDSDWCVLRLSTRMCHLVAEGSLAMRR